MKAVKDAKLIAGTVHYGNTEGEKASLVFRRSLFAVKDIKAGELFTSDNVRSIRPGTGIKPKFLNQVIGKVSNCDVPRGTPINFDMIEVE